MKIITTKIKGLIVVKQNNFKDQRGSLRITHNENILKKKNLFLNIVRLQKKMHCEDFIFRINFYRLNMSMLLRVKFWTV